MGYKKGRKKKAEGNVAEQELSSNWTSSAGTGDDPSYTPATKRRRRRRMEGSEEQGDSGAGAGHHHTSSVNPSDDPPFSPPAQGILSDLAADTTSSGRRYLTRSRLAKQDSTPLTMPTSRRLLTQCKASGTSSRLPVRNVKGDINPYFTLLRSNLAETAFDELLTETPPQTQVLNSQTGGDETVRDASPYHQTIQSVLRSLKMPVLDNLPSGSRDQIALPSSARVAVEHRTEGSGINCHERGKSHLSRASSFNYTEVAQLLEDDGDEVESAPEPALVTVNGYRVKEEFAPILRSILSKYGDIAKSSIVKSTASRSRAVEGLCGIYKNLQEKTFTGITVMEIDSMMVDVEDLETLNLEVGWFLQRLREISDSLVKAKGYRALKGKEEKLKDDLNAAEEKIRLAKKEHAAVLAEGEKTAEIIQVTKAQMRKFQQSMVVGLV